MRRFVLMLSTAAACAMALQPAVAERQCTSQADQAMFNVEALRSELMVLATGCRDDENYNAFIQRYRPELMANERAVGAYFNHHYGRAGQTQHDRFVTDLANALSHEGSQLGTDFCPRNGMIFREVMALRGASELPTFAAGKNLLPASLAICQAPAPVRTEAPVKTRTKGKAPLKTAHK